MIKINKKEECCGCSACSQCCPKNAILMQADNEGFLYPAVDYATCIECGLCEKVCPVQHPFENREPSQMFAAINRDDTTRKLSSSGGIFSVLAEKIVDAGGVVFGARFDDNWDVLIDYTETKDGIALFRGSKYVQASVGESYKKCKEFLKRNRKVLFSGTPCQISGLYHFLGKDDQNLITIDIACHGVPSPLVWNKYLYEVAKLNLGTETVIDSINFRDKTESWKRYHVVINCSSKDSVDGNIDKKHISEWFRSNTYMQGFLSNMTLRPSCYECKFKSFSSGSDITLADYWGVKKTMPAFDDDKGVSLLIINSRKAADFIKDIDILCKPLTYDKAIVGNPVLFKSSEKWYKRDSFFNQVSNHENIVELMQKELKPTFSMKLKKAWYVVKNLSTVLRNKIKKHK